MNQQTAAQLAPTDPFRRTPWGVVGTDLDRGLTATEALQQANLAGWNVRKTPLTMANGQNVPNKFATVRTIPETGEHGYLGIVGNVYVPIQNEEHTEFLDTLTDQSGACYESAGSLNGGKRVFVSMRFPDTMLVGGVDPVDTYITAFNSHDGNTGFRVVVSPLRVFCANQQAAAIAGAVSSVSVRHTLNHKSALTAARDTLGLTFKYIEGFQAEADKMIETALTEAAFAGIVKELMGDPEKVDGRSRTSLERKEDEVMALFTGSETAATIRGTRWAGYQAVTEWADYFSPASEGATGDRQATRSARVVSGGTDELKARAFSLLAV